ncbi:hypothetical protein ACFSTH_02865 [Paenibacillus yanchengensis]|uniref:Uncharacterized protein n=1 Tax=Paenibacillus yanchengensis TaxID=2035833 RepID=A0ABW4YG57_9BACL
MKLFTWFTATLLSVLLLLPASTTYAASYTLTTTAQKNFDKLTKESEPTITDKLTIGYNQLQTNRKQELELEQQTKKLKSNNQAKEKLVRSAISQLDNDHIQRLNSEVAQVTKKYDPIIKTYEQQRQQLTIIKQMKPANKEAVKVANVALALSKAAADQAKQIIRNKKAELTKAKAAATARKKELRAMLTSGSNLLSNIKNANSTISKQNKLFTDEGKLLTNALRLQSAKQALNNLQTMNTLSTSINGARKKIVQYEQEYEQLLDKINNLIVKT